jgi:pimeloyl-ACP methyl ester carboxylesterase
MTMLVFVSSRCLGTGRVPERASASIGRVSRVILGFAIVLSLVLGGHDTSAVAQAGTSPVGVRDIVVDLEGRTFDALLTYPATSTEPGAPVAPGRHPVVAFGHGYLSPVEWYASTFDHLASSGYIVVAPRSGGEPFPDHAALAHDLALVVPWLTAQDWLAGGALEDRIDVGAIAVAGHSMGGGAAILAAAEEPGFASVVTLAAAETRPSAIEAAARIHAPTLFIAGELDTIAPVDTNQRPMFEALLGAPARLEVIPGGSHCGFIDPPIGPMDALTDLVCDTGTIDRSEQLAITWTLMTDWLGCMLPGRPASGATIGGCQGEGPQPTLDE